MSGFLSWALTRNMNKKIRIVIDISMAVLLPLLMAYSLIGETFHEVTGTIIFVLFIIHHILNRRWYSAIFKGKYQMGRIFRTVLDVLLLVFMILQPVSGILLSKHLFTFLPVLPVTAQERSIHMMLAYWGYVLLCVHEGTHLTASFCRLAKRGKKAGIMLYVILGGVSVYGCFAFLQRGFPGYMSGRTAFAFFDHGEPIVSFILDYLAVMVLFMMAGCLIIYGLGKASTKKKAAKP